MPHCTIDPTLLYRGSHTLAQLIKQQQTDFILAGNYELITLAKPIRIKLTHSLLIRARDNVPGEKRIEVLDDEPINDGCSALIYQSLGVLIPEENYRFKIKPPEKSRICKVFLENTFKQEQLSYEGQITKLNAYLHCKTPVFAERKGFLVMREIKEMDLHTFIRRTITASNTLSLLQTLQLTHAIVLAIKEQVVDLGLIHTDIKPENIMIAPNTMKITLIDYGTARRINNTTLRHTLGTRPYIAPEVIILSYVSPESDLFSLGSNPA